MFALQFITPAPPALAIFNGLIELLRDSVEGGHRWAFLAVFVIYVVLLSGLIPVEEAGLQQAYGEPYRAYRRRVKKLVPFVY